MSYGDIVAQCTLPVKGKTRGERSGDEDEVGLELLILSLQTGQRISKEERRVSKPRLKFHFLDLIGRRGDVNGSFS